jgi:hypothetical protein
MGFQESGQNPAYVIRTVNTWIAESLYISPPSKKLYGLSIVYLNAGNIRKELINNETHLDAIYKICRGDATDIFYLLTRIHSGKVKYIDFINFVRLISAKINEIQKTKEDNMRHKLGAEIMRLTTSARKKLLITN